MYAGKLRDLTYELINGKEVTKMAGKSKTDVAARTGAKTAIKLCSNCGNKVDVVMSVSASGKKSMKRLCCEL